MRHKFLFSMVVVYLLTTTVINAQVFNYPDSKQQAGILLKDASVTGVNISYSISQFELSEMVVDGETLKHISIAGSFIPNDAGAPDLPGFSRYIAIPQGAGAKLIVRHYSADTLHSIELSPAPVIPLDTEEGPLEFKKDSGIYAANAYYPSKPFQISATTELRGVDAVMLGITPFQYNPVTKELIVYYDVELEISFIGGIGHFGDDRLRSRWWDQILMDEILNSGVLPTIDYNKQRLAPSDSPDYEYLIISPDVPVFLSWADSIKNFRTLQGIKTGIVTTTEIGGNTVSAIESYVDNAYNNWTVAPSAVLLLGDYSTSTNGITSQIYTHPAGYDDFVSDNRFADVTGNDLPDIVFARITANNEAQLEVMITKFLDYERNPPTSADFYDHPITALGWQTERWFQICSEVVGGYLRNEQGKNPVRINAVYEGNPASDPWSTATNTSTVLNYFGPNGLNYIPATPAELGGFSGGTATQVVNAINNGSYLLQHRDHGYYGGWGEPAFNTTSISSLHNINNELPFIFSINCQTGAFHRSSESFAEKFHRYTYNGNNSGALGIIAATEVSYSFVNDVYVWGVFDNLHPDFMPGYSAQFPANFVMPAFGNAAGKHFLYQSSWPYNTSSKQITYRLFHHHGDAFMTLFTEVPQNLAVSHATIHPVASTDFSLTANAGSLIAITAAGEILATATGTGSPLEITIPQQNPGSILNVTVTKQNYYRYSAQVEVISTGLFAQFTADVTTLCSGGIVNFSDETYGNPVSWTWSFPGGNPAAFNGQTPPSVFYVNPGNYDVALTVSDGTSFDTRTKAGYVTVSSLSADFTGSPTTLVIGDSVAFTDNSTCNPTSWSWSFPGGTPASSTQQHPVVSYNYPGVFNVTLLTSNGFDSDTEIKSGYIYVSEVPINYCSSQGSNSSYEWISKVDFNDFSNTSGSAGYTDFTNLEIDMAAGEDIAVTLTPAFSGSTYVEYWRVWIDYNRDGDFEDTGEQVFAPGSGSSAVSGNFTVAAGSIGKTRMRVSMKWNGIPTPCETFGYGEVEDYTVNFITQLPPEADFVASVQTILEGESVNFTDLSTNSPTAWSWEFDGGTPEVSSAQNPSVTYNNAGSFAVKLTATNPAGSGSETKFHYITVIALPGCTENIAPANGSTNINIADILLWNETENASGYKIYFGTNNPPTNIADGTDLGNVLMYAPATLMYETQYYWKIVAYNEYGEASGCPIWSFITEEQALPQTHFVPAWTSPFNPMTIYVLEATLENDDLQPGDEIGLFDTDTDSGNEVCVGMGAITEILGGGIFLEIIASMDDGSGGEANGFIPGNTIIYKYWNSSIGETENISANYPYQGYDELYTSQGTAFVDLSYMPLTAQFIPLQAGWNMVSFRVEPENMDMMGIVQPLIDEDLFFKIIDEKGNSVFHLPFPLPNGQWSNTIGDMACTEGYYLKVYDTCALNLEGVSGSLPMQIELVAGWNMVSYPCACPTDAMNIVQPLIDAEVLYKVVNENGGTIFHLPFPPPDGQWANTIGNFESGEGYYLKVTENITLTINEPVKGNLFSGKITKSIIRYFDPVYQNNPYLPMHIILNTNNLLTPGDEVAVFDGEICVGAAVYDEHSENSIIITCSADDTETEIADGFISGNDFRISIWDHQNQVETNNAQTCYIQDDEYFRELGTGIFLLQGLPTGINTTVSDKFVFNIFPNPVINHAVISMYIPEKGALTLEICDIFGAKIRGISQTQFEKGFQNVEFSPGQLPSGYYLLKYIFNSNTSKTLGYTKFIIIR